MNNAPILNGECTWCRCSPLDLVYVKRAEGFRKVCVKCKEEMARRGELLEPLQIYAQGKVNPCDEQ